jgi:CubicO group peptidase (beta-lactamase class C family)
MAFRSRRALWAALLTLVLAGPLHAQHFPSTEQLRSIIQSRVDEGRAVAIVLGVMEADGSTRIVTAGEAGPVAHPLGERSVFEIGSITKVFTGILLADMVQRGEVSLGDPVSKYLPTDVTIPSRNGREITLLDLSTHRSALPRLPGNMAPKDASNPYADYTVDQLYAFLSSHQLRRDIGSQYEYSNLAVGLLGHVLGRVAGMSYEDLVRSRILAPLGMTMSGITLTPEMQDWMVAGHNQGGAVVPLWDLPTLAAAGALRSNMLDMFRFLAANIGPPAGDVEQAMRASHIPHTEAGPQMQVGLNWHIQSVGEKRIVWHNGGTGGFRTFIGFDPDERVGVVVLTNSAHGADDIGFHLINTAIPLTEPPRERTAVEVDVEILATYVGEYEVAPNLSFVITLEDDGLHVQPTGQNKAPIFPESETEFFFSVVDAQITFQRDDTGKVTGLVLHQGGQNVPGRKVK